MTNTGYTSNFDTAPITDLANLWTAMASTFDSQTSAIDSAVHGMAWRGDAQMVVGQTWEVVQAMQMAGVSGACLEIASALNQYASAIQSYQQEAKKQAETAAIIGVVGQIIGVLTLVGGPLLGIAFRAAGLLIEGLMTAMVGEEIAATVVGTAAVITDSTLFGFVAGATVGSAIAVGEDALAHWIASEITGTPFSMTDTEIITDIVEGGLIGGFVGGMSSAAGGGIRNVEEPPIVTPEGEAPPIVTGPVVPENGVPIVVTEQPLTPTFRGSVLPNEGAPVIGGEPVTGPGFGGTVVRTPGGSALTGEGSMPPPGVKVNLEPGPGGIETVGGGGAPPVSPETIRPVTGGGIRTVTGGDVPPVTGSDIRPVTGDDVRPVTGGDIRPVTGGDVQPVPGASVPEPVPSKIVTSASAGGDNLSFEPPVQAGSGSGAPGGSRVVPLEETPVEAGSPYPMNKILGEAFLSRHPREVPAGPSAEITPTGQTPLEAASYKDINAQLNTMHTDAVSQGRFPNARGEPLAEPEPDAAPPVSREPLEIHQDATFYVQNSRGQWVPVPRGEAPPIGGGRPAGGETGGEPTGGLFMGKDGNGVWRPTRLFEEPSGGAGHGGAPGGVGESDGGGFRVTVRRPDGSWDTAGGDSAAPTGSGGGGGGFRVTVRRPDGSWGTVGGDDAAPTGGGGGGGFTEAPAGGTTFHSPSGGGRGGGGGGITFNRGKDTFTVVEQPDTVVGRTTEGAGDTATAPDRPGSSFSGEGRRLGDPDTGAPPPNIRTAPGGAAVTRASANSHTVTELTPTGPRGGVPASTPATGPDRAGGAFPGEGRRLGDPDTGAPPPDIRTAPGGAAVTRASANSHTVTDPDLTPVGSRSAFQGKGTRLGDPDSGAPATSTSASSHTVTDLTPAGSRSAFQGGGTRLGDPDSGAPTTSTSANSHTVTDPDITPAGSDRPATAFQGEGHRLGPDRGSPPNVRTAIGDAAITRGANNCAVTDTGLPPAGSVPAGARDGNLATAPAEPVAVAPAATPPAPTGDGTGSARPSTPVTTDTSPNPTGAGTGSTRTSPPTVTDTTPAATGTTPTATETPRGTGAAGGRSSTPTVTVDATAPRFVPRTAVGDRVRTPEHLPTSDDAVIIGGPYRMATNRLFLDGRWRDPAQVAQWIRRWTAWTPETPTPIVLVSGQAGHTAGPISFAQEVSDLLDAPVVATSGHPVQSTDGNVLAGTPAADGSGGIRLYIDPRHGWDLHLPGQGPVAVGHHLTTVLGDLGIRTIPAHTGPPTITVWSFGPEAPARIAVHLPPSGTVAPQAPPVVTEPASTVAPPATPEPATLEPDTTTPNVTPPDITLPNAAPPDAAPSNVTPPDAARPTVAEPNVTPPDIAQYQDINARLNAMHTEAVGRRAGLGPAGAPPTPIGPTGPATGGMPEPAETPAATTPHLPDGDDRRVPVPRAESEPAGAGDAAPHPTGSSKLSTGEPVTDQGFRLQVRRPGGNWGTVGDDTAPVDGGGPTGDATAHHGSGGAGDGDILNTGAGTFTITESPAPVLPHTLHLTAGNAADDVPPAEPTATADPQAPVSTPDAQMPSPPPVTTARHAPTTTEPVAIPSHHTIPAPTDTTTTVSTTPVTTAPTGTSPTGTSPTDTAPTAPTDAITASTITVTTPPTIVVTTPEGTVTTPEGAEAAGTAPDAGPPETGSPDPVDDEQLWQAWLDDMRTRLPGPPQAREPVTWAQANEWVDAQVRHAIDDAAFTFQDRYGVPPEHIDTLTGPAREDAWTDLLRELGVDIDGAGAAEYPEPALTPGPEPAVAVPARPAPAVRPAPPGRPPIRPGANPDAEAPVTWFRAPRDTVAHHQAADAVPRAVGWHTLIAHFAAGAVFDGEVPVGGTALAGQIGMDDNPGAGVVMVVCNAATTPTGGVAPAADLHAASGNRAPVLAPTGEAMVTPDGDVLSGTWTVGPDLEVQPVPTGDWVVWRDGAPHSLGTPSLTEALAILNVASVAGGAPPATPVGFYHDITAGQRATLNQWFYREDDAALNALNATGPPPRSFYDALLGAAGDRIRETLGPAADVLAVRGALINPLIADLGAPDSRYRPLLPRVHDAAQFAADLGGPEFWDDRLANVLPHVAADVFNLDLGLLGPLGHPETVGDLNGPRRGRRDNGDPFLVIRVGEHFVRAVRQAGAPPGPAPLRELRPRFRGTVHSAWADGLSAADTALVTQAADLAEITPAAVNAAVAAGHTATVQRVDPLRSGPGAADVAAAVTPFTDTIRAILDLTPTARDRHEFDAFADSEHFISLTPGSAHLTARAAHLTGVYTNALVTTAAPPAGGAVAAATGDQITRATGAADLVALYEELLRVRNLPVTASNTRSHFDSIRTDAETRANNAYNIQLARDIAAVPPANTDPALSEAQRMADEIRYRGDVANIRANPVGARRAAAAARQDVINNALAAAPTLAIINSLAPARLWHDFAQANERAVADALRQGEDTRQQQEQQARDAAKADARAAAEWRIRQNNALDALLAPELPRYLPPGFGEPGLVAPVAPGAVAPVAAPQYPMGRGGRFVRLGNARFSDHDAIAGLVAGGLPAADAGWAPELQAAVTNFLGRHGSHVFGERLLHGGVTFPLSRGLARNTVHVQLDLGDLDLVHQATSLNVDPTPIGQKAHIAVEADHELITGNSTSSTSTLDIGATGNFSTPFGSLPNMIFSATAGFGLSGQASTTYSRGSDAVSATKRLFDLGGDSTYFDIPGAALATTTRRLPGPIGPGNPRQLTPLPVRVAFPTELAPRKPASERHTSAMPRTPLAVPGAPVLGVDPAALGAELDTAGPLHTAAGRLTEVPSHFLTLAESASGLDRLRGLVHTLVFGTGEPDPDLAEDIEFYLGEGSFLRMYGDITGPGSTSPLFTGARAGDAMHLTVNAALLQVQAVSVDPVPLKEESQRFVNISDNKSQSGGFSAGLTGKVSHVLGDPTAAMGGNSSLYLQGGLGGGSSTSRSANANTGSGHISGLVYNGDSVRYRAVMRARVEITRPGGPRDAPPVAETDIVVHLRIPLHQQARFEHMVTDALRPVAAAATPAPADVDNSQANPNLNAADRAADANERGRVRHPPPALAAGVGTGFSAIDHLGGSERVLPAAVGLVLQAGAPMAWSRPYDAMEVAYLRRELSSRFTGEALKNWGSALFQPNGVGVEIRRPAVEGTEVVTVTVHGTFDRTPPNLYPTPTGSARVHSAKLELMPSAFAGTSGNDSLGSGISANVQFGGSGGIGLGNAVRTVGAAARYDYGRRVNQTTSTGASGFMLEAILYNGAVRTFDYDVGYTVEVTTRHETGTVGVGWMQVAANLAGSSVTGTNGSVASANRVTAPTIGGSARFVVVEPMAPMVPVVVGAQVPGDVTILDRRLQRPPVRNTRAVRQHVVDLPNVPAHLNGHAPLNPDDQVTEVLGSGGVAGLIETLLADLDIPPQAYGDLPRTIAGTETLASQLVRGPSTFRQTLVVPGYVTDRIVEVSLTPYPHNLRDGTVPIPIFQMHVAEGNGSVSYTRDKSRSHSVNVSGSIGILDNRTNSHTDTSSLSAAYTKELRSGSSSRSVSLTPTTGRLTQGSRIYVEDVADVLWQVTVTAHDKNAVYTGQPTAASALAQVTDGLRFLRLANPVADPRDPAIPFPPVPAGAVAVLRTDLLHLPGANVHPGWAAATPVPTVPSMAGRADRVPVVPVIPPSAASERLLPPARPAHVPGTPTPALEVTGEGNPVLDAVQRLLHDNAPSMLDSYWTVQNQGGVVVPAIGPAVGTNPSFRQVPARLANLLNVGSLEALIDLMLGPGLILNGIKSLPLANRRIQIMLRATRDPNNRGYAFLEHVDDANVSRYSFRLNNAGRSESRADSQSWSINGSNTDSPADAGRLANANSGPGPSFTTSSSTSRGVSRDQTDAVRDTFFVNGPADRYAGDLDIEVTLIDVVTPSRFLNTIGLTLPRKIANALQRTGDRSLRRPAITVPMLERVLIPTELLTDNIVPAPAGPAVTEVNAGATPAQLGLPAFPVTPRDLLDHRALSLGFDPAKLRILFDAAMTRFAGNDVPLLQRNYTAAQLADAGTRASEALHYTMSYQMFTRQLELMLGPDGLTMPTLVGGGGALTDTSGEFTIRVELADPHVRGYVRNAWNEAVDYGFTLFGQNRGQNFGWNAGIGQGATLESGDLSPQPPGSHQQQNPSVNVNGSFGASASHSNSTTLKTMPRAAATNTKVPWLRVSSDAIVHLTLRPRTTRDLVDIGMGEVTASFRVSNALEVGLAPEVAHQFGLLHPQGVPVPSGVFVPARGAGAHGVADDGLNTLRAVFAIRPTPGMFAVHVQIDSTGRFIVGDRALTAAQFYNQVLAGVDLTGREVVLISDGAAARRPGPPGPTPGLTAAEELATLLGRPVIAPDSRVYLTRDGSVLTMRGNEPTNQRPDLRHAPRGHWVRVHPAPATGPRPASQPYGHDLHHVLSHDLNAHPGPRPAHAPPPEVDVRRGHWD